MKKTPCTPYIVKFEIRSTKYSAGHLAVETNSKYKCTKETPDSAGGNIKKTPK